MVIEYFSERERGARPRTLELIDVRTWGGIVTQIKQRVTNGSFGLSFPDVCPDGHGTIGSDDVTLGVALRAEVNIDWPLDATRLPDDQLAIWDTLEFLFEKVSKPVAGYYHPFFGHHHLAFESEPGRIEFAADINRLLARNGIAFELTGNGQIRRLLPEHVGEQIARARFQTGDDETNRLLEAARVGITSPSFESRKMGLEKLWDAFERLKTLEPGLNKKISANALLDKVDGGPKFRELLGVEAVALTDAGNNLAIRHFETNRELLQNTGQIDYLFFKMFAFLQLLLRASGRGG